jgi:tetratricopeptide (TPR) repeat protein
MSAMFLRWCAGCARVVTLTWTLGACAGAPAQEEGLGTAGETSAALHDVPPDLAAAEARWKAAPADLSAIVWYGRRTAYEGRFEDAIAIFTAGLQRHPQDPELLRHRGHRYLSLRRFAEATRDLELAARVIEGRADRIEPDGLPNEYGVPRSTLHTNVWYHLGLAYHCQRMDARAADAFARCLALATNDDYKVAAAYWRSIALHHLGRPDAARALAALFARRDLELMESFDYAQLLRLFAGTDEAALERLAAAPSPLSQATLGYGVALWHRMNGRDGQARELLEELVSAGYSSAFGRLAAEVELERM